MTRTSINLALTFVIWTVGLSAPAIAQVSNREALPGTELLTLEGDLASHLVDGADRFLLRQLESSIAARQKHWQRDFTSAEAYVASVAKNRRRFSHQLGVRDARPRDTEPRYQATVNKSSLVGRGQNYEIHAVTWAAFGDVHARGLLLEPKGVPVRAQVIAVPDCNVLPEQLVGLLPGVAPDSQYARRLAENGCRVLVPLLVNRQERLPQLTNREWLYRAAFEMGRGLIAYEVQQILAAVDWMERDGGAAAPIGVFGWGEGGLLSLYAGALDTRITATGVSGYFDSRQQMWTEPLDRNVFGLLDEFGDAELATLIAPRALVVEASLAPEVDIPGGRGAPAKIVTPDIERVRTEIARAQQLTADLAPSPTITLVESETGRGPAGSEKALTAFLQALHIAEPSFAAASEPTSLLGDFDAAPRHANLVHQLDRHTQFLLSESHYLRQENTINKLDFSSVASYEKSAESLREFFYDEVIGRFDGEVLPFHPRTRMVQQTPHWTAYEVVLDVYPDVIAYGLLLIPRDLRAGERRPVVVCQHGLEGRPQDTIGEPGFQYYSAFAARLAERGFITFAPQNLYIFQDRFRTLQRKANPLKKTLFSLITPQHQQIVDWLQTLDFVDPQRIGFYGLSYGGKTAMRVPALVPDYCLSICSADFNEWVDKNASTRNPRSYVNTGEYEIFEFDLGSTFNYAEMAALIAPRPFMVERGHFDGVADDWTVAYEYAKVRHLYAARLKLPERTEIEFFDGPHSINGQATYQFLYRHLNWQPTPGENKPE
ncbi:MAG: alpha/beta hydrolase family protein [Pirellulaceae bacterium]|nr:alpha/beta hydrolase family protein [Pirellulaceae bacterium]